MYLVDREWDDFDARAKKKNSKSAKSRQVTLADLGSDESDFLSFPTANRSLIKFNETVFFARNVFLCLNFNAMYKTSFTLIYVRTAEVLHPEILRLQVYNVEYNQSKETLKTL